MLRIPGLVAIGALSMTFVHSAPALAAGGWTSAPNGVLYSDCRDHPFSYAVELPAGTADWSMDVYAYSPDGLEASSDFIYDAAETGTGNFFFCGYEMPGRYTIEAEVEACDADYDCSTFSLDESSFYMRKPRTKTLLSASPLDARRGQVVKFVVTSKDERPRGYFRNDYARVYLQRKDGQRWVKIKGSQGLTGSNGKEVIKLRYTGGRPKVRAVTAASDAYSKSTSKPVTIR
jgi:hypothetical protein